MTTIAVSRTEMACDSRTSWDAGDFLTCDDKIERVGDALVGCSGHVGAICRFLAWFKHPDRERAERPDFEDDTLHVVVLDKTGIYYYADSTYASRIRDPFYAAGSGSMAAKAAMLCGKSPAEAVAVAIKCDKNSGGPVRKFQL